MHLPSGAYQTQSASKSATPAGDGIASGVLERTSDVLAELHGLLESQAAMTILVVDDDASVRKMVCAVLKNAGYGCVEATGAEDALSKVRDDVALVLSDVVMPEMDGLNMAKQIRNRFADLPILFMSGYNDVEGLDEFRCLNKPFASLSVVVDGVRDAIESTPGRTSMADEERRRTTAA